MSTMRVQNATFYCFKGWSVGRKYYTTGRGHLSSAVFEPATVVRLDTILRDNDGKWPGLSGTGAEMFRIVVPDEDHSNGYPLMFDPSSGLVVKPETMEK